ncbi:metal ABC transporter substrate-binding protein [Falsirhodobacter sp. alg1]|uniref:metal ABC transporter substrate-binding protein n=1 Tax=Falsirhodobacter sp. alg1 TaxID=1472418 RepID=UPI0005EF7A0A|nr:metal ABC transporter substrate-binding protein [Falsirhodobacter sp. alg1]
MRNSPIRLALASLLITSASGLAAQADTGHKLKVVTTFTILQDMAQNVAGDAADVVSITKPGAEIHGYEPTPQDIVRASDADLILYNGLNLERWFQQFIDNLGDIPSVVLTDGIDPISIAAGEYEGLPNPHGWMGLENASIYVDNIRDALSEYDPENADTYAANAEVYKDEIEDTVGPLRERIQSVPESSRWLVSCEGAFSYLAKDFGLQEAYLWPINADQTGTPQQVRSVVDVVRTHKIPAVFCESTVNQAPAQQVARETGANYGGMLYVDSLSAADGPVPTYLDLLRIDAETIADALAPHNN